MNPFISTIGWILPVLVSGEVIVAQVLSLPTTGPMLLEFAAEPGHVPRRLDHPDH